MKNKINKMKYLSELIKGVIPRDMYVDYYHESGGLEFVKVGWKEQIGSMHPDDFIGGNE